MLAQIAAGASNREIAGNLGIAKQVAANYRRRIMKKFGTKSAADLVRVVLADAADASSKIVLYPLRSQLTWQVASNTHSTDRSTIPLAAAGMRLGAGDRFTAGWCCQYLRAQVGTNNLGSDRYPGETGRAVWLGRRPSTAASD